MCLAIEDPGGSGKYAYSPSELSFSVDETVTFILSSESEDHTLGIEELDVHVEVDEGQVALFTYTFSNPGTYELSCRWHKPQGMVGSVTVE